MCCSSRSAESLGLNCLHNSQIQGAQILPIVKLLFLGHPAGRTASLVATCILLGISFSQFTLSLPPPLSYQCALFPEVYPLLVVSRLFSELKEFVQATYCTLLLPFTYCSLKHFHYFLLTFLSFLTFNFQWDFVPSFPSLCASVPHCPLS